jgi:hypothetical protein
MCSEARSETKKAALTDSRRRTGSQQLKTKQKFKSGPKMARWFFST